MLDLASGTLCQDTDGCMEDIASHYQNLWDTELQVPQEIVERYRYIYKWINSGWKTSKKHPIAGAALGALSSTVNGATDGIIQLTRSAICAKDGGNQVSRNHLSLPMSHCARFRSGNPWYPCPRRHSPRQQAQKQSVPRHVEISAYHVPIRHASAGQEAYKLSSGA